MSKLTKLEFETLSSLLGRLGDLILNSAVLAGVTRLKLKGGRTCIYVVSDRHEEIEAVIEGLERGDR